MIPKTPVTFTFGGANQEGSSKQIRAGKFNQPPRNARATKRTSDGQMVYGKRPGFSRTVPGVDQSSFSGTAFSAYSGGRVDVATDGKVWAYDTSSNQRRLRGSLWDSRPFPTYTGSSIVLSRGEKPLAIGAGNDIWLFCLGDEAGSRVLKYSAVSISGETEKSPATSVVVAGCSNYTAVTGVGVVWVFWVANGTTVNSLKFDISNPAAAPVAATYVTVASEVFASVDCHALASTGEIVVAAASRRGASPNCINTITHSYLNPATGAARASPAPVTTSTTRSGIPIAGNVSILVSDGTNGSFYYTYWRNSSTANQAELILATVNATTLVTSSTVILADLAVGAGANASEQLGCAVGHLDSNGVDKVVLAQVFNQSGTTLGNAYDMHVTRYTYNGAVSSSVVARSAWIASKPSVRSGVWFFMTGFDDGQTAQLQRTLYLRRTDGTLVSRTLQGNTSAIWHYFASPPGDGSANFDATNRWFKTTAGFVGINATGVIFAPAMLTIFGGSGAYFVTGAMQTGAGDSSGSPMRITWDFAAKYSKPASMGRLTVIPGAIPLAVGPQDSLRELTPLQFPPRAPTGSGGVGSVVSVACVYKFVDSEGRFTRSSPSVTGTWAASGSFSAPTLRHQYNNGLGGNGLQVFIELYSSVPSGSATLKLIQTQPNVPTSDSITFTVDYATVVYGETIYTALGLSNAPAPPCRCVQVWNDRLHASGTPIDGEIWSTAEFEAETGPRFNEVMRSFFTADGSGPVVAMERVDSTAMAAFKQDSVAVLIGSGPDGKGSGNYQPKTITTEKGLTALSSLTSTPWGPLFQNAPDGRICAVSQMQVVDVMQGADDSRSLTVVAAEHSKSQRATFFAMSDATLLIMDHARHPADEANLVPGQWYVWSSSGLGQVAAIVESPTGLTLVESAAGGVLRSPQAAFTDATSGAPAEILMKFVAGDLAPGGLIQEFDLPQVAALGEYKADHTVRITTTPGYGVTASVKSKAMTAGSSWQLYDKPAGCQRIQAFQMTIEETASVGEGFVLVGVAATIQARGRTQSPNASQRL